MAVGVKQHAVARRVRPAVRPSDDVVVVPAAGCLADRMPVQSTLSLLSAEEGKYLTAVAQLVLHPLDSRRLPLQLVRRIIRLVVQR